MKALNHKSVPVVIAGFLVVQLGSLSQGTEDPAGL